MSLTEKLESPLRLKPLFISYPRQETALIEERDGKGWWGRRRGGVRCGVIVLFYFIKLFYFIGTCFSFRSILVRSAAEWKLRADMMFPRSWRGLASLLTVIYFSVSVAPSLPLPPVVEWCANPLYSSDKCIDQYKQTAGHKPKWKP